MPAPRRVQLQLVEPPPLRKPVNTLAIVPQNEKITPLARKAWNVLLYEAQEQGLEQTVYRAPLERIVRGVDFGSNDHKIVKDHLRSMVSTTVEWQSPTIGEGTSWHVCGLLAHAHLFKIRGQVWVEWSYAVNLRQELLQPTVFARLSLPIMSQLRTHAGLVLYEICTRYKDIGRTSRQHWKWWWPVLTGRPASELTEKTEYRIFKRDTLRPAIAEAAALTDFEPELVEYKQGRFISELQFLVHKKSTKSMGLQFPPQPVDIALLERALALGVDHVHAEQLAERYGAAALAKGLDALAKRMASAFPEPLRNPYRYLNSMMPAHAAQAGVITEVRPVSPEFLRLEQKAREQKWSSDWLLELHEQIAAQILTLPAEEQQSLVDGLVVELELKNAHPALRQRLISKGWQHAMVRNEMVAFYARATRGEEWNLPNDKQLLEMASRSPSS